jgi:cell division transport system permease protein
MTILKIIDSAKKNNKRNRWLSFSTVFVTTIVFTISSFFITLAIFAHRGVQYYEQKAQVIIFFQKTTSEADILSFRDQIFNPELVESIDYVSKEAALAIYKEDFADSPELISTVTADSLPASLEVRAKDIDSLLTVIGEIDKAKQTNPEIDEVMYFSDVVDNIKTMSTIINIGAIVLIVALGIITFSLIRTTIGFNIKVHQEEIQIMQLVGGTERFIKLPFMFEGAFYGMLGGLIASLIIIIPWYIIMYYTQQTDFALWFNQLLTDLGVSFIKPINPLFLIIYLLSHTLVGFILGLLSRLSSIRKYL